MTDVPVRLVGLGIPETLDPMWESWNVPCERVAASRSLALERPDEFAGECLYVGMNAAMKHKVAAALPGLKSVKNLVIDAHVVPQPVLDSIAAMPQLKRLYLAPSRTGDLGFLDALEWLEYLTIESAPGVSDLGPVLRRKNLVSLCLGTSVSDLDRIGDGCLENLRCLVLQGAGETKPARLKTLQPLAGLRNLEYLCPLNCRVDDESLSFALGMPKLKAIHLYSTRRWCGEDIAALVNAGITVTRTV